jgi:hypothetical protein
MIPKADFAIVMWESQIPAYENFVNIDAYCDENKTIGYDPNG